MSKRSGMEALPLWLKLIFALPGLDIIWMIYRVWKSVKKGHVFGIILGIVFIIIGIPFVWLIDIITLLVSGKIFWID